MDREEIFWVLMITRFMSLLPKNVWTTQLVDRREWKIIGQPEKGVSSFQESKRSASHEARGQKDSPAIFNLGISQQQETLLRGFYLLLYTLRSSIGAKRVSLHCLYHSEGSMLLGWVSDLLSAPYSVAV